LSKGSRSRGACRLDGFDDFARHLQVVNDYVNLALKLIDLPFRLSETFNEQMKQKKAPFEVRVSVGAEAFVFSYKE
jgi:hypothetical protein